MIICTSVQNRLLIDECVRKSSCLGQLRVRLCFWCGSFSSACTPKKKIERLENSPYNVPDSIDLRLMDKFPADNGSLTRRRRRPSDDYSSMSVVSSMSGLAGYKAPSYEQLREHFLKEGGKPLN